MSTRTSTMTAPSVGDLIQPMEDVSLEPASGMKTLGPAPNSTLKPVVFIRHDTFSRFVEFEGGIEVCELIFKRKP